MHYGYYYVPLVRWWFCCCCCCPSTLRNPVFCCARNPKPPPVEAGEGDWPKPAEPENPAKPANPAKPPPDDDVVVVAVVVAEGVEEDDNPPNARLALGGFPDPINEEKSEVLPNCALANWLIPSVEEVAAEGAVLAREAAAARRLFEKVPRGFATGDADPAPDSPSAASNDGKLYFSASFEYNCSSLPLYFSTSAATSASLVGLYLR